MSVTRERSHQSFSSVQFGPPILSSLSLALNSLSQFSPVLSRKEETRAKAVSNSILLAPVGKVRLFFDDPSLDSAKKLTKTCRILEEKGMKVSPFLD